MAKGPSPLLGFNNNVRHRGKVFHIQTEDSGVRHPHVITHLFSDGGRIIKTTKTSYAEHLGGENMATVVRQLMKEQHKAMFLALRGGLFDDSIEGEPSTPSPQQRQPDAPADEAPSTPSPEIPASGEVAAARRPAASFPTPDLFESFTLPAAPSREAPPASRPSAPPASAPPASAPLRPPPSAPARPASVGRMLAGPTQPPRPSSAGAGGRESRPSGEFPNATGGPPSGARGEPRPAPPASARARPQEAPPSTETPPAGSNRAASRSSFPRPTRPAGGRSIFGDDMISEKSLDEVILSYLADDLDGTSNLP